MLLSLNEATTALTEATTAVAASLPADAGFTEKLAFWFANLFSDGIGGEIVIFITSLLPILECRGGMIVAKYVFDLPFIRSFLLCYIANMIPVPFILLLIKKIFEFMKKHNILKGFIEKLEGRTSAKRDTIMKYKQWGLLLFVAIPLPGTGAWTGSLCAALLDIDFKKALPIIALGVLIANLIMTLPPSGVGAIFNF